MLSGRKEKNLLINNELNRGKAKNCRYMNEMTSMISDVLSEKKHKVMPGPLGFWLRRGNRGIY